MVRLLKFEFLSPHMSLKGCSANSSRGTQWSPATSIRSFSLRLEVAEARLNLFTRYRLPSTIAIFIMKEMVVIIPFLLYTINAVFLPLRFVALILRIRGDTIGFPLRYRCSMISTAYPGKHEVRFPSRSAPGEIKAIFSPPFLCSVAHRPCCCAAPPGRM